MAHLALLFAFLLSSALPPANGADGTRPSTLGRFDNLRVALSNVEGRESQDQPAPGPVRAEPVEARTVASPSAPASVEYPIPVHLMTVIDQTAVLGGQRVAVREARVKEAVGPRLIVVGHPRRRDFDITYEPAFPLDSLLVLLPPAVSASPGQVVAITGIIRTVSGARTLGLPVELDARHAKNDPRHAARLGNRPLLVADSVETVDGSALGR